MKIAIITLIFLFFFTVGNVQADDFTGTWSGSAKTDTEQTEISLTIKQVGNELSVSMSLANIGVSGWPAQSVEIEQFT
jgi:hypothetical protein